MVVVRDMIISEDAAGVVGKKKKGEPNITYK